MSLSKILNKVISFSLWGENAEYLQGAFGAIESAKVHFPDWNLWFYTRNDVPESVQKGLISAGAKVIPIEYKYSYSGMALRFLPASDSNVDVMLSRDADSTFTAREASAVGEWLLGKPDFHIIRDHPDHMLPIMGGLWGCRNGILAEMHELLARYPEFHKYGSDQKFLAKHIYPKIKKTACIHSEAVRLYGEQVQPFPMKRTGLDFIGRSNLLKYDNVQELQMQTWIQNDCPLRSMPNIYTLPGRAWLLTYKIKSALRKLYLRNK